ncbi:MAG: MFS transporter [Muribaculaceae bacterium]|nr:MFS transporter [Muribaculaceae bacterium]MDE5929909.1 MFS transporter [Muribaculaceae bacterium]
MQVKTGKGNISLMVVLAIWSLSLAVDLPGLAVTPIEGSLHTIFPDVTDFKIQLLTVLPNLVIIPFVLLSGKLSETKHKIAVITLGTILYIIAGAWSIFSGSLTELIWLSCLLGAGCGLILPFSTGLIADVFTGKYRMKQMGIISAIGNIALVGATFVVGFLAAKSWHLPFLVYLIPLISLVLIPFLRKIPKTDYSNTPDTTASSSATTANTEPAVDADGFSTSGQTVKGGFYIGRTIWLLLAYFFFVFATSVPAYYLPDLMPQYNMSTEEVSTVTSIFYLAMFAIGLIVTSVMKVFRKTTFILATALIVGGMLMFVLTRSMALFVIASALVGLGNGLAQPIFYTKATELVTSESKSTLSLAYLQVANYVAISMVPVIISFFADIFGNKSNLFPFVLVFIFSAMVLAAVIIRVRHFVFGISKHYYQ